MDINNIELPSSTPITGGERLKQLIHDRGLTIQGFSVAADVSIKSIYAYFNGRKMPEKFLRKAAAVLDTNMDYLKMNSDNHLPQYLQNIENSVDEKMKAVNRQTYRFNAIEKALKTHGADIRHELVIGGITYSPCDNEGCWKRDGNQEARYDEQDIIDMIIARRTETTLTHYVIYNHRVLMMNNDEYNTWLLTLYLQNELSIQAKFGTVKPIEAELVKDNMARALAGEPQLMWQI